MVSVPCFSAGFSITQAIALERIILSFRGWSVEHGCWPVAMAHITQGVRRSTLSRLAGVLLLLERGVFFPELGSVCQFLEHAFEVGVYSWSVEQVEQGHITVRLAQPPWRT